MTTAELKRMLAPIAYTPRPATLPAPAIALGDRILVPTRNQPRVLIDCRTGSVTTLES